MQLIINLNADGFITVDKDELEEAAAWCKEHKRGLVLAHGPCEDANWQHLHHAEHKAVLERYLQPAQLDLGDAASSTVAE